MVAINGLHIVDTCFYWVHRILVWGPHLLYQQLFFSLCDDLFLSQMVSVTFDRLVEALIFCRHNVLLLVK